MENIFDSLQSFFKPFEKPYRSNPQKTPLSKQQQLALNIGTINSEQTMYYCDSLKTGYGTEHLMYHLEHYGVIPGDNIGAREILDWLYEEGHSTLFDEMIKDFFIEGGNKSKWAASDNMEYAHNIIGCIPMLIEGGWISEKADIGTISTIAWDMGRLVNVTRTCYDCKYITEDEAWEYLHKGLKKAQSAYVDWENFATGYVVGRAMWGGNGISHTEIYDIARGLLNDEESPWKITEFKE